MPVSRRNRSVIRSCLRGLCRACPESKDEMFDIGRMEREIVERARDYTTLEDYKEILAEIQHFGRRNELA